jgi:hypothetical protein
VDLAFSAGPDWIDREAAAADAEPVTGGSIKVFSNSTSSRANPQVNLALYLRTLLEKLQQWKAD